MRFRTFRGRILFFLLSLMLALQTLTFSLLDRVQYENARRGVAEELRVGARTLERLLAERSEALARGAASLSRDFAFLNARATGDRATIDTALESLRGRIGADTLLLIAPDGARPVVAAAGGGTEAGGPFVRPDLIDRAEENGEPSSALASVAGTLHRVVIVPLLSPEPVAWFCAGFRIDDAWAASTAALLSSHVGFAESGPPPRVITSSRPAADRAPLAARLAAGPPPGGEPFLVEAGGDRCLCLLLPADGESRIHAVVERSIDEALAPYRRLRALLLLVTLAGLLVAALGGHLVAGSVSRPVRDLAAAAARVEAGDFAVAIPVRQSDEIGALESSFNRMVRGLAERDRVRDLLGKVVSPQIAAELLRAERVELGGEERTVTILFSDIRGFTTLCEGRAPSEILALLNGYLTRMSRVIEAEGGVIDKFIGDAIMALFGAPVAHPDDARRAFRAALGMAGELEAMNREAAAAGDAPLGIGIGINTALVVAGNMGSGTRLNYTVIGDGVNLASRLESETKAAGVPILVSEESLRAAGAGFLTRPLGEVTVKGKREPTRIHALLGTQEPGSPADGEGSPDA